MSRNYTTIVIEYRVPNLTDVVNPDARDELRSHLRSLAANPDFYGQVLGVDAESVPIEAEMLFTVDFGD